MYEMNSFEMSSSLDHIVVNYRVNIWNDILLTRKETNASTDALMSDDELCQSQQNLTIFYHGTEKRLDPTFIVFNQTGVFSS